MNLKIKYRGRVATTQDVSFIRKLIAEHPDDSRRALSQKLCEAWNWRQSNGVLRDMVCRGFMLRLDSVGLIKLPPKRCSPNNPFVNRKKPQKIVIKESSINAPLSTIRPLEVHQVRYTTSEKLFNSLIEEYHYLDYCHPVGEHLKYLFFSKGDPIACMSWSSASLHIGCRDKFIGWSVDVRKKNIHMIAYNSRFLILPFVKSPYLASHILGIISKILPVDWKKIYNHPIHYLETFVDTERFKGTCYKAANWQYIGKTTGRGKKDKTHKINRSIKAVWGYPLSKKFKEVLRHA